MLTTVQENAIRPCTMLVVVISIFFTTYKNIDLQPGWILVLIVPYNISLVKRIIYDIFNVFRRIASQQC